MLSWAKRSHHRCFSRTAKGSRVSGILKRYRFEAATLFVSAMKRLQRFTDKALTLFLFVFVSQVIAAANLVI